jgi:hypothetical protein
MSPQRFEEGDDLRRPRAVQRSIHDSHTEDRIDATEGDAMPTI